MHIEFGSDIDTQANKRFLQNAYWRKNYFPNSYLFRSGRDALRLLARLLAPQRGRVLLPALCCSSMVEPFLRQGMRVSYYPLFTGGDYGRWDDYLEDGDVLLYMDYFGMATDASHRARAEYLTEKKKHIDLLTISDMTHSLRQAEDSACRADFALFSVRKWASLPDGGVLASKRPLHFSYDPFDGRYTALKKEAMDLKSRYLKTKDAAVKQEFIPLFRSAEEYLSEDGGVMEMSELSKGLLRGLDFVAIEQTRKQNAQILFEMLEKMSLLPEITEGPLFFPILADDQLGMQEYLAERGIYCPVIWPMREDARGVCEWSDYAASHMLALPCDQRYSPQEMEFIGNTVLSY